MSDPAAFASLDGEDHVSLATFRRSGEAVPTALWFGLHEGALYARSRVVVAAAVAGVSALDSPFMDVPALDGLAAESRRTRGLGFNGKAAIHPTQVAVIQAAFSSSMEEVAWARRIVEAYDRNQGGVLLVDGKLIERPVIASAKRTLAVAAAVDPAGG